MLCIPKPIIALLLTISSIYSFGQTPDYELEGTLVEDALVEAMINENGSNSLVVDVTRTKIGRDFYEAFYLQWNSLASPLVANAITDSVGIHQKGLAIVNPNELVIVIEDLPTPGAVQASLVSISIDNELLWQQFVPIRRELIDEYAANAVETMQAYFAERQLVQMQLDTSDQSGTGIY